MTSNLKSNAATKRPATTQLKRHIHDCSRIVSAPVI